ncbi:TPA: type IV pilin [Vibrio harveyi]
MRLLSGFSAKEWLLTAVVLGGLTIATVHYSNQRTSAARSAAIQVLFADMQYYVSLLHNNAKAFKQDRGANQCVLTALGYQGFYNGYPETQSECGEQVGFFDNLTITDEMKQADLVFIENNRYSIVGYGSDESPEALMANQCYAYYRMDSKGVDGHSFRIDTTGC